MWSATLTFRKCEKHNLIIDYFCTRVANIFYKIMANNLYPDFWQLNLLKFFTGRYCSQKPFLCQELKFLIYNSALKNSKSMYH